MVLDRKNGDPCASVMYGTFHRDISEVTHLVGDQEYDCRGLVQLEAFSAGVGGKSVCGECGRQALCHQADVGTHHGGFFATTIVLFLLLSMRYLSQLPVSAPSSPFSSP